MTQRSPYEVIKRIHVTEKSMVLRQLQNSETNRCVARCKAPKYVFIVDQTATKTDIRQAVEELYRKQNVKVAKVNTIQCSSKPTRRRGRGRRGKKASFKKAIVTFEPGDSLEEA